MNTAQALIAHLDQHTLADNDNIRLTLASALVGYRSSRACPASAKRDWHWRLHRH